jgi:hypothetical protein
MDGAWTLPSLPADLLGSDAGAPPAQPAQTSSPATLGDVLARRALVSGAFLILCGSLPMPRMFLATD